MHDITSQLRVISSETAGMETTAYIGGKMQADYRALVDAECRPGMTWKECDNTVESLIRAVTGKAYPLWRIRAIRQGDAGHFSAAAYHGWNEAIGKWQERRRSRAASQAAIDRQRKEASDRQLLEQSRAECIAALAKIESRLALLTGAQS